MKEIDKNSPKSRESSDTWIYILFLIAIALLVGSAVWYFWPSNQKKEWSFSEEYYEKELGKKLTSPTAKEVSKLIGGNRARIKAARRVLEDKSRGRKLSAEEKADVQAELDKVNYELDEKLQGIVIEELEKNNPDSFAALYSELYEQGKIATRLKSKTAVNRSHEQLMKQMQVQEEWGNSVSEEETKDVMDEWIRRWYEQARKNIIDSGREKLLATGVFPFWEDGKKIVEPTEAQIKALQTTHTVEFEEGGVKKKKVVDFSTPFTLEFNGYWGFLTEKDKKDSSEGSEVFGLTKSGEIHTISPEELKTDQEKAAYVYGNNQRYQEWKYIEGNHRPISIGLEKKLFFNQWGHEEWITNAEKDGPWVYFHISFEDVVDTIAHELAHAIVNTIRFDYHGEEGGGHGEFFYKTMKEVEEIIKEDPEFPKFKTWWETPEKERSEWARDKVLTDEKSHWDRWKYWYISGGVGVLAIGLAVVIVFWDKPTGSKKNAKI